MPTEFPNKYSDGVIAERTQNAEPTEPADTPYDETDDMPHFIDPEYDAEPGVDSEEAAFSASNRVSVRMSLATDLSSAAFATDGSPRTATIR